MAHSRPDFFLLHLTLSWTSHFYFNENVLKQICMVECVTFQQNACCSRDGINNLDFRFFTVFHHRLYACVLSFLSGFFWVLFSLSIWKCIGLLTSELVKQFCGSSRFLRRFRGANSVCGESCGGGGIADASWNNVGGDFDASPSDCWSICVYCVNGSGSVSGKSM